MSLLQENVYFFYRKVNKNAYFTLFEVNKNVNLVIFNMSKIAFCRFATLVVIVMLVILRENDLSLERPRELIRSQVVGISCLSCCKKSHPCLSVRSVGDISIPRIVNNCLQNFSSYFVITQKVVHKSVTFPTKVLHKSVTIQ